VILKDVTKNLLHNLDLMTSITVHDSDILVPETARPGGLFQRSDSVRGGIFSLEYFII
jgi:hypothetical protein